MSRVLVISTLVSALLIYAAWVIGGHANAQSSRWGCLPHMDAVESLLWDFNERSVGMGGAFPGNRKVQLFVSKNGNWTFLGTGFDGVDGLVSCKIAEGADWIWHGDFHIGQRS